MVPSLSLANFKLIEHSSSIYAHRTFANIFYAHGTLLFGERKTIGSRLTINFAYRTKTPVYIFDWPNRQLPTDCDTDFLDWLTEHNIIVLNVAGNRESLNPGITDAIGIYLTRNINYLRTISP